MNVKFRPGDIITLNTPYDSVSYFFKSASRLRFGSSSWLYELKKDGFICVLTETFGVLYTEQDAKFVELSVTDLYNCCLSSFLYMEKNQSARLIVHYLQE